MGEPPGDDGELQSILLLAVVTAQALPGGDAPVHLADLGLARDETGSVVVMLDGRTPAQSAPVAAAAAAAAAPIVLPEGAPTGAGTGVRHAMLRVGRPEPTAAGVRMRASVVGIASGRAVPLETLLVDFVHTTTGWQVTKTLHAAG